MRENKVEHIRDAVLKRAEDKHHNREDNEQSLYDVVLLLVLVNRDKHTHTATDSEKEHAEEAVTELCGYDTVNLCGELVVNAGEANKERDSARSDKVAEPDKHKRSDVGGLVVKRVSYLAGEKVETECEDGQKSDAE